MNKRFLFITIFATSLLRASLLEAAEVQAIGQFSQPGQFAYQSGLRLKGLLLKANPKRTAYLPGLSIERLSAKKRQAQHKRHLLSVLSSLTLLSRDAKELKIFIESLPITGRMILPVRLDAVFAMPQTDPQLHPRDKVFISSVPQTIAIVGWGGNLVVPFESHKLVSDYVSAAPKSKYADKSYAYLIKPDGKVKRVRVAYWNNQNQRLAPGSIIYLPIDQKYLKSENQSFNWAVAQFLSTQRVPLSFKGMKNA